MTNYEYELNFLRDVLNKCHIHTALVSHFDSADSMFDPRLISLVGSKPNLTVKKVLGKIEDKTKYILTNEFKFQYIIVKLPLESEKNILLIGPYLYNPLSSKEILEIGENLQLTLTAQKLLKDYYLSISIIPESDRIFAMIDAFCENIWQTPSFAIVELNKSHTASLLNLDNASRGESFDEIEANIKMMEARYSFENELIRAVTLGQQHKESLFSTEFKEQMFEKRAADPVRNAKNYCIIMNTLLRKAAEQGGVHPVHIDKTSSKLAMKIELLPDVKSSMMLMKEIFSSYCRLVYKNSMKQYSPIVKKTILVIASDISAELSLDTLAQKQGISKGYLATIFKKETGKTVLEYIKDKRIEHAMYLLTNTHLQIQTIALHCGIMDVQYFSKIFKKKIGMNPKEYRESARR